MPLKCKKIAEHIPLLLSTHDTLWVWVVFPIPYALRIEAITPGDCQGGSTSVNWVLGIPSDWATELDLLEQVLVSDSSVSELVITQPIQDRLAINWETGSRIVPSVILDRIVLLLDSCYPLKDKQKLWSGDFVFLRQFASCNCIWNIMH